VSVVALVPDSVSYGSDRSAPATEFQVDVPTFPAATTFEVTESEVLLNADMDADPAIWFTEAPVTFQFYT
jgi:hypothetical protein